MLKCKTDGKIQTQCQM